MNPRYLPPSPFSRHYGFKCVDVVAAYRGHLLDLDGKPIVGEKTPFGGLGAYAEDGAIDSQVADLHFVGDALAAGLLYNPKRGQIG